MKPHTILVELGEITYKELQITIEEVKKYYTYFKNRKELYTTIFNIGLTDIILEIERKKNDNTEKTNM